MVAHPNNIAAADWDMNIRGPIQVIGKMPPPDARYRRGTGAIVLDMKPEEYCQLCCVLIATNNRCRQFALGGHDAINVAANFSRN